MGVCVWVSLSFSLSLSLSGLLIGWFVDIHRSKVTYSSPSTSFKKWLKGDFFNAFSLNLLWVPVHVWVSLSLAYWLICWYSQVKGHIIMYSTKCVTKYEWHILWSYFCDSLYSNGSVDCSWKISLLNNQYLVERENPFIKIGTVINWNSSVLFSSEMNVLYFS